MRAILLILIVCIDAASQDRIVTGPVTFIAGPTLYASIGRKNGLADSSVGIVQAGTDTLLVLKLEAVSSKSSSWSIVRSSRDALVGDVISVRCDREALPAVNVQPDTIPSAMLSPSAVRNSSSQTDRPWLDIQGRISAQYYGVRMDDARNSSAQPGFTVSLRASARDLPLQFVMYGTHRQLVRGGLSPWEPSSRGQSRLYRFSLEYDDSTSILMAGRIYPMYAPTVSSVDGMSYARRFGRMLIGIAGGAEPALTIGSDPAGIWKGVAFIGYKIDDPWPANGSLAYTRSYRRGILVREAASVSASMFTFSGFSLYGFGDIDLRRPLGEESSADPSLTSLMLTASARVLPSLSLSIGLDAARPIPSTATIGIIPDTLIDRTLRSGLTSSATITVRNWNWTIGYSPRMSPDRFGREYAGTSSIGTYDLLETGIDVRATANVNRNAYTDYSSIGVQLRRTVWDIDCRLRTQFNSTTVRQVRETSRGTQAGVDAVVALARSWSLAASLDLWRGAGVSADILYIESSWRF